MTRLNWYEGLRLGIHPDRLARVIRGNLKEVATVVIVQGGGFLLGWGICFLLYKNKAQVLSQFVTMWPIWVPSILAILLYSLIHIETRYLGPFVLALLLTAYTGIQVPKKTLALCIAVVGLLWSIIFSWTTVVGEGRYLPLSTALNNTSWNAAKGLQELGLHDHDKVASVCYSNRRNVLWARLAKVQIIAETDWHSDFWRLSEADQHRALMALARTGASMAISDEAPPDAARALGWQQVGDTDYYAYSLSELLKASP
jgi:hypothetical protein